MKHLFFSFPKKTCLYFKEIHSVHVYTINGRYLHSLEVLHRTTSLLILDHEHILHGDENGELSIRDLYTKEIIHR